jgi:hypothetical protein
MAINRRQRLRSFSAKQDNRNTSIQHKLRDQTALFFCACKGIFDEEGPRVQYPNPNGCRL